MFCEASNSFRLEWLAAFLHSKRCMMSVKQSNGIPLKFVWKSSNPNTRLHPREAVWPWTTNVKRSRHPVCWKHAAHTVDSCSCRRSRICSIWDVAYVPITEAQCTVLVLVVACNDARSAWLGLGVAAPVNSYCVYLPSSQRRGEYRNINSICACAEHGGGGPMSTYVLYVPAAAWNPQSFSCPFRGVLGSMQCNCYRSVCSNPVGAGNRSVLLLLLPRYFFLVGRRCCLHLATS